MVLPPSFSRKMGEIETVEAEKMGWIYLARGTFYPTLPYHERVLSGPLERRHSPEQILQVTDESVHVALAGRLVDDVLVIVIAQTAAQLLVVHLGFVLPGSPPARHLSGKQGNCVSTDHSRHIKREN